MYSTKQKWEKLSLALISFPQQFGMKSTWQGFVLLITMHICRLSQATLCQKLSFPMLTFVLENVSVSKHAGEDAASLTLMSSLGKTNGSGSNSVSAKQAMIVFLLLHSTWSWKRASCAPKDASYMSIVPQCTPQTDKTGVNLVHLKTVPLAVLIVLLL